MFFFSLLMVFSEEKVHIVQRGDTIFSIARSFGVNKDELMRVNGITDPTKLQVGQHLKIPGNNTAAQASVAREESIYRVVRGDTLFSIARNYGITVAQIQILNGLSSDYVLKVGDVLRIPGIQKTSGRSSPGVPAASTAAQIPSSSVRWPVIARELSYITGNTGGVAITGERAEPVKSLTHGTVISAGPYRGYGQVAIVRATGGYIYVYGGCETLMVKEGDRVGPGMEMGRLGIDAITEKPRLFFRVYLNNNPVDPAIAPRA
jgi:murein DD-endopeptidase MepM/ murein hydrolase activator NlpD